MNLTFGICWIEDQASDAEIEAVEAAVRSNGFEPEMYRVETEEDIRVFAERQYHFQDFDLILLDLRLGKGLRGDELAPEVRGAFRSTPILFYSAEDERQLREKMADRLVEGVYCTHRDRLSERVGELVGNMTPALNRLSGMRGLAARVVAECDYELRTILLCLAGNVIDEGELVASLKKRVEVSRKELTNSILRIDSLKELLDHHAVSSGSLFREVYSRVGDLDISDDVRTTRRAIRKYPECVLARRNILAHALEERTEDGWRIVRPEPHNDLTVQEFVEYRAGFLAYLRDIRQLRGLLVGQDVK